MSSEITKQFFNTAEDIVDENIKGLVLANRNLQILKVCLVFKKKSCFVGLIVLLAVVISDG